MPALLEEQTKLPAEHAQQAGIAQAVPKPIATIQSWAVVEGVVSQRFAALEPGNRLRGHVLGLGHVPYAKLVHTSPILSVDPAHGLVETRNTIYRLGQASEEYESWRAAGH